MNNFFSQLYKKSLKSEQNTHANFSLQYDKIEKGSKGVNTENETLKYLAKILVEAYFKQKKYEHKKQLQ